MKVILLKEHDRCLYIDASTQDQLESACLSILRVRCSRSEYKEWVDSILIPVIPPVISFDIASSLPECKVRDLALSEWAEYHNLVTRNERLRDQIERTERALKTNNGKLAYRLLYERRHCENEGFELYDVYSEYPVGE
jgi:hypothetical protein